MGFTNRDLDCSQQLSQIEGLGKHGGETSRLAPFTDVLYRFSRSARMSREHDDGHRWKARCHQGC